MYWIQKYEANIKGIEFSFVNYFEKSAIVPDQCDLHISLNIFFTCQFGCSCDRYFSTKTISLQVYSFPLLDCHRASLADKKCGDLLFSTRDIRSVFNKRYGMNVWGNLLYRNRRGGKKSFRAFYLLNWSLNVW